MSKTKPNAPRPSGFWRPPNWIHSTKLNVDATLAAMKKASKPGRKEDTIDPELLPSLRHPYEPETREVGGVKVLGIIDLEKYFDGLEFYTRGKHALVDEVSNDPLAVVAEEVLANAKLLRDAWNTAGPVWRMVRKWTEPFKFTVDPFSNVGTLELPDLVNRLDGSSAQLDGLAHENGWPINWRGDLPVGSAAAAVNGPHSDVAKWLSLCARYGQEEIVAAFVPDAADVWWFEACRTAALVFRFGRVHCSPPPGITPSSPRSTSAVLLWLPESIDVSLLPEHTRACLAGRNFTTAYDVAKGQGGVLRNRPCTISAARNESIDFGFGVPMRDASTPAPETESKKPKRTRKSKEPTS